MTECSLVACTALAVARFVYMQGHEVAYPAVCVAHVSEVARCGYQIVALTYRGEVVA